MRMSKPEPAPIQLFGKIGAETAKAIQFKFNDHPKFANRAMWFPLSQTKSIHREFAAKGNDRLVVSAWIYGEKLKEVVDETGDTRGVDNGFSSADDSIENDSESFGTNPFD